MRKLEKLGTWSRTFLLLSVLCFFAICAQAQTVSGVVKDQNGDAVIGATVKIVGSKSGTVTDSKGHYSIEASNGSILSVSYVGYLTKQMRLRGENVVDIVLMEDNTTLNDLVVVGYGVQKKSDLTGAVASVKAEELKGLSTTDAGAALQGKASGVQVLNTSGKPGEGAKIRVRGYSSNTENLGPLLIVDGLKVESIQYLDPSMIESMEVLKDAASAAIYGVEAGNGVVLITTKNGQKGTGTINYTGKFTNQKLGYVPELLNASEFIDWMGMVQGANNKINSDMAQYQKDYGWDPNTDTNWLDEFFEDTWATQHTLTFQGGNERGSYFLSTSYVNQDGIVKGNSDKYERLTAQINADYQIKDWLKVGTNTSIEKWSSRGISENGYGSAFEMLLVMDPLTPVYWTEPSQMLETYRNHYLANDKYKLYGDENGQYATSYFNQRLAGGSPFTQRDRAQQRDSGVNVNGSAFMNLTPTKWLTFTSRLGYRLWFSNQTNYDEPYYINAQGNEQNGRRLFDKKDHGTFYQWENFANFNQTFGKHAVGAMLGMAYRQKDTDYLQINVTGSDILRSYESNFRYPHSVKAGGDTSVAPDGNPGTERSLSYFGRLTYSFDDRYSLQGNFRSDAYDLSKLAKDNRWGTFYSGSAAWTFSNESFFKNAVDSKIMSYGKIRVSWGTNGSLGGLQGYKYTGTLNTNESFYNYGTSNAVTYGSKPGNLANPNLTWEKSEQLDLGADFRFLSSRLSLGVDWYKKITKDLLLEAQIDKLSGFSSQWVNGGEVENSGLEIELSWKDNIGDFKYGISANMATLKNKVVSLREDLQRVAGGTVSGASPASVTCYCEAGHPLWYIRGYKFAGVDAENKPLFEHYENGEVTLVNNPSDADMTEIGSGLPDVTYGITLNAEYKGIDLTIFGAGAAGNDVFYGLYRTGYNNIAKGVYDDFKSGKFGDADKCAGVAEQFYKSSAMVYDGSYFKIKQIQLGYTFPKEITKKIFMENLRAYISLDDFFTFTSYPGLDPETTTQGYNCPGLDRGAYPIMKKMILGVSVTF